MCIRDRSEAERSPVAGWLEGRPEAPAAVHADGAVTTRAELARRVSAAAAALADMPAGSRIAVDADAPHNFAAVSYTHLDVYKRQA